MCLCGDRWRSACEMIEKNSRKHQVVIRGASRFYYLHRLREMWCVSMWTEPHLAQLRPHIFFLSSLNLHRGKNQCRFVMWFFFFASIQRSTRNIGTHSKLMIIMKETHAPHRDVDNQQRRATTRKKNLIYYNLKGTNLANPTHLRRAVVVVALVVIICIQRIYTRKMIRCSIFAWFFHCTLMLHSSVDGE